MDEYLIGLIFLVLIFFSFGLLKYRNPGEINSFYSYRTKLSKRNQDTWDEANMYAGKCVMLFSMLSIITLVVTDFISNDVTNMLKILGTVLLISFVCIRIFTERRLKKVFFRDGKRKPNR